MNPRTPHIETVVLAGGCFWCLEAAYQMVKGVTAVTTGYAGGHVPDPTYYQVVTGTTGHAESVRVDFDSTVVKYEHLLEIFWLIHDPTTLNRQGQDIGPQYRSVIFYQTDDQHAQAEASKAEAQKLLEDPIVTEIVPLEHFYVAEPEQQNYFVNHPEAAYCQIVINPKLKKLKAKYGSRLKEVK
jgi:peptide-methionine (S)-S-oxide reductase